MSIFKNLSLCIAFLAVVSCSSTLSSYDTESYYVDDFSMEEQKAQPAQVAPVEKKKEVKPTAKKLTPHKTLTEVSKKVADIEKKLREIQKTIETNSEALLSLKIKSADEARSYYEHVAQINARLRIGTTPGNPELSLMWDKAVAILSQAETNASQTSRLAADDVRLKNELESLLILISSTYKISGAMEFDHENLRQLEDEANQTIITLRRLSSDTSSQISRQEQFYATETRNIDALKTDIRYGKISGTGYNASPVLPTMTQQQGDSVVHLPQANLEGRRPLMVINFSQEDIAYKQQLYKAVKLALEKIPSTNFEVVAVLSPAESQNTTIKNAKEVYEALIEMGIPSRRLSLSETTQNKLSYAQVALYLK